MTTTVKGSTDVQLQPYIFFYGRCEEALEFYKNEGGRLRNVTKSMGLPPLRVMRARSIASLVLLSMKWTEPSQKTT